MNFQKHLETNYRSVQLSWIGFLVHLEVEVTEEVAEVTEVVEVVIVRLVEVTVDLVEVVIVRLVDPTTSMTDLAIINLLTLAEEGLRGVNANLVVDINIDKNIFLS